MGARYVIDDFYVYAVAVVYATSCCSHGSCCYETTPCRNTKHSSIARYPSLFDSSAFRGSWSNPIINILPWHSFQPRERQPITNVNFQAFNSNSQSKYTKLKTLTTWHTVDSCLAYSGLMKNGVCQLFFKFAYWVTEFWIRWLDYYIIGLWR